MIVLDMDKLRMTLVKEQKVMVIAGGVKCKAFLTRFDSTHDGKRERTLRIDVTLTGEPTFPGSERIA